MLLAQAGVTLAISLALAFYGRTAAFSALAGGAICVVANGYAAWRSFTPSVMESAHGALSSLYRAEVGKLVMMAALFIAVFAGWKTVNIGAFIAGCAAAMVVGIIGAAFQRVDQEPLGDGETGTETDG